MSFVNESKRVARAVCVLGFLVFCLYIYYNEEANKAFDAIINWEWLYLALWFFVFVSFIADYFGNKTKSDSIISKHCGHFIECCFNIVTFGLAATTSVSLLKGMYSQHIMGQTVYFQNFHNLDYISIFLVALYLFIKSIGVSGDTLWQAISRSTAIDIEKC